jgi:23S rRNA pseudouridine2605 synthase
MQPEGERLQKVLAHAGIASRRSCEELIAAGRVSVNGVVAELGRRVDVATDRIEVDGTPIPLRPDAVYYLVHKPAGVVTTADDPHGRDIVTDLVPADPRVFPVGRLDRDTEGLLILTNDGELTHRLTHPRFGVDKEYLAHVEGSPSRGALRRLREGVELEDGMTAPATAALVGPGLVRITIHEGRNRQVRRMLDAVGHPVRRLVRVRIGPVADRSLAPGTWRALTRDEVMALEQAASADPGAAPGPKPPKRPNRSRAERSSARASERSPGRSSDPSSSARTRSDADRPAKRAPTAKKGTPRPRGGPGSRG